MGEAEGLALEFFARPGCGLSEGRVIASHAKADASELVGQSAGGLVVTGSGLEFERAGSDAGLVVAFGAGGGGGAQHGSGAVSEQHAQVRVALGADSAEVSDTAEENSLGVRPNQEAKCRASVKCATEPAVAAAIAVELSKPMPGIVMSSLQGSDSAATALSCRSI